MGGFPIRSARAPDACSNEIPRRLVSWQLSPSSPDVAITITDLSKVFRREGGGETHVALDGLELTVREGEFFCLLGPSGCGKTTLLNLIAGFEQPSGGKLE